MSQSHEHQQEHTEEHESPIKTPKQLIVTVLLAFIVPIIVIILLVSWVTSGTRTAAGSDALGPEATALRIAPVARIELVDATAPRVMQTGEQVYNAVCAACHTAGVAGALKFGDKAAWTTAIGTGLEAMIASVINGKGAMPPKGGNPSLDDLEIARAVVYMANAAGGDFQEPAEPAADAAPAEEKVATAPAQPAPAAATSAPAQETAQTQAQAAAPTPAPAEAAPTQAAAAPAAGIDLALGEKIYKQACFACHAAGVAGAPKLGDKAAWGPYIATGMDTMVSIVISGKGAMPPKGGLASASEGDIRAAVAYMVEQSK